MTNTDKLLEIKNLSVVFPSKNGVVHAVNSISYDVYRGEVMGIVGESGSGKSASAYAVMQLLASPGKVTGGDIRFEGKDVLSFSRAELQDFRGSEIGMIFQNPMQCLDPVFHDRCTAYRNALRSPEDKPGRRGFGLCRDAALRRYPRR